MIAMPGLDRKDVDAFAASDPAVKNGLLVFGIKPWMIVTKLRDLLFIVIAWVPAGFGAPDVKLFDFFASPRRLS